MSVIERPYERLQRICAYEARTVFTTEWGARTRAPYIAPFLAPNSARSAMTRSRLISLAAVAISTMAPSAILAGQLRSEVLKEGAHANSASKLRQRRKTLCDPHCSH